MTTTLLAVDDSVTMRKVYEITFAGENFKTVLASSAQEAVTLAKTERPALALLDHTLSDMSGYDLCRELKAAVPGMAVVIMSSKVSPYDKARGSATGVDDFMDKPFDTQKLLDKVSQVLSAPRAAAPAAHAPAASPAVSHAPAPRAPAAHAPAAHAPAAHPAAVHAQSAAATARPRSPTLAYGSPSAAPATAAAHAPAPAQQPAARPMAGTPAAGTPAAATPRPAVAAAAPRLAAQPAPAAAPAPAHQPAAAIASAVAAAGNGQLGGKLQALGLSPQQVEGVLALSREVVEKVVWEVVPVLAETLIKEEIRRLTSE